MLEGLAFVKRFWHWFAIAGLLFVVLYLRGDNASLEGRAKSAEVKAATLQKVNDANAEVIKGFTEQRLANDAIIQSLAGAKTANATREVEVRTVVERAARNDPTVRDWLNQPIPSGVRGAINAPGD
ncbi:hypothetical protein P9A28_gp56 [Sphingomonas phage Eidolon]|uniref:Uncharacterized protein n=1 Tax=Sphingomonas phage Eidolon TaxID=2686311 RepID=A0A6M3TC32_9CAUD|nr:hypothetical protein P9A28_gp56 [Sphingomonas phage Eidolon]QJD54442.1 hypothetical protein [Sphingomonas phage Eidolon]